jgi:hypothetical protein
MFILSYTLFKVEILAPSSASSRRKYLELRMSAFIAFATSLAVTKPIEAAQEKSIINGQLCHGRR